ncbi:hypothetical protein O1B84_003360 [Vibrio cholerae]|nr:hypothetical protein [Vibrio cholerae]EJP3280931.1 hypothetical protein [Vibrio cholerae]EKF9376896.1 hypothetical protein [Vibrio cholerae]EKF9778812.1 hypothetical protein [Vibrio cholerae]ELF1689613.1 hypothetical protein [Vibrio cholerae]
MVKYVLGIVTGFTATIWYVALDLNFELDSSLSINIVIATATIIATAIHYDSVRQQKRERVWEINKENLLSLSRALSSEMKRTALYADRAFYIEQGIPIDDSELDDSPDAYKKFKKVIDESLDVYKPLLNKELIEAIEAFQKEDREIDIAVENNAMSVFEAYDAIHAEQKKLHSTVSDFIKKAYAT